VTPTFPKTDPRKIKELQKLMREEDGEANVLDPTGTEQAARELLGLFHPPQ
jgi:hypothetical protein